MGVKLKLLWDLNIPKIPDHQVPHSATAPIRQANCQTGFDAQAICPQGKTLGFWAPGTPMLSINDSYRISYLFYKKITLTTPNIWRLSLLIYHGLTGFSKDVQVTSSIGN